MLPSKTLFYSWLWGTAYFVANLWWTGTALLVDKNPFLWALPLAVIGFPALLAFFPAVIAVVFQFCRKFWQSSPLNASILFTVLYGFSEYGRGYFFTGFPWNIPAYIWSGFLPLLQSLSFFGPFTLSLLTIMLAALSASALFKEDRKQSLCAMGFLILFFVSLTIAGVLRIEQRRPDISNEKTVIRLIQPNIPQAEKWDRSTYDYQISIITELLTRPVSEEYKDAENVLAIAPETALNETMLSSVHAFGAMDTAFLKLQSMPQDFYFYSGILRSEVLEENGDIKQKYFNGSFLFNKQGQIVQSYNKFHLVPFGEYMPFSDIIPIEPIVNFSGFEFGEGLQTIKQGTLPSFSPLICYEILFPTEVVNKDDRPDFIVNITNDAWYGFSPGPFQHLLQAQYRAIEEGISVFRAANTGISAVYDPYGQLVTSLPLAKRGVVESTIPSKIKGRTIYSLTGNLIYFVFSVLLLIFVSLRLLTNRN